MVGYAAGYLGRSAVDFGDVRLCMVVSLADAGGVEGVGGDDISTCLQVAAVYLFHHIRTGEAE